MCRQSQAQEVVTQSANERGSIAEPVIEDWPSAWEMGRGAEVAVDAAEGVASKGAEVELAAGEALAVRLESAERFVAATGAVIVHGGDRAYYQPAEDRIQLPPVDQFRSSEGYYATALHELTHWSGHKSRLDRDLKGRYRCAGLRLRDGGLCRRRAGGGDRCGFPVRESRGERRTTGGSRPLPQELDRCPEGR
jgi:antirestriction protein ArdC